MFFWSLLLAHVIGDFPLQTDAIFRLKTRYSWGVLPHVLICSIVNTLVLIPYLSNIRTWMAIFLLGFIHIVLDRTKISVSEKISRDNFFQFFIDQALHVFSVWLVALWLSKTVNREDYAVVGILANRDLIIQLTAYIFAAFAGVPIIFYALKFWLKFKHSALPVLYPNFLQRVPGYFERFLATLGVVWSGWWLLLTIGAFLPRLILKWRDADRPIMSRTAAVGLLLSLLCGIAVHLLT
ncbi:DUF3307 domain-containing protein [candidate division KSB1 bacterium]|nr:DUF3307 domain-containing protein [candidate division KSB1 bacterium]RQW10233.1 MAG: DUF3307 domain-containing protein [candidate division KSB1 bacterium]